MRTKPLFLFAALWPCLALPQLVPCPAAAAWPYHPKVNVPLCTAAPNRPPPDRRGRRWGAIVTWSTIATLTHQHLRAARTGFGSGGPGMACKRAPSPPRRPIRPSPRSSRTARGRHRYWSDDRGGSNHIYAQRVLASGAVDPAWPADGRALCTRGGARPPHDRCGRGWGAIVIWQDGRSGDFDIYAQRVLASGAVDPAWPANGRPVCTAAGVQAVPRSSPTARGARSSLGWTSAAAATTTSMPSAYWRREPWIRHGCKRSRPLHRGGRSDHRNDRCGRAGGAIVTWEDLRGGSNYDIYAHAYWRREPWIRMARGRARLCTAGAIRSVPRSSPTAGGAIVTGRTPAAAATTTSMPSAYWRREPWIRHGLQTVAPSAPRRAIRAVPRSSPTRGGAIVTWQDYRTAATGTSTRSAYWLRERWIRHGLRTAPRLRRGSGQYYPTIVEDGAGGAIVTWEDLRGGNFDIYAQWIAPLHRSRTQDHRRDRHPCRSGWEGQNQRGASYWDILPSLDVSVYGIWRQVEQSSARQSLAEGARLATVQPRPSLARFEPR
jgi:hypothetical protein